MVNKQLSFVSTLEGSCSVAIGPEEFGYQGTGAPVKVEFSTPENLLCQDQKPKLGNVWILRIYLHGHINIHALKNLQFPNLSNP